MQQCEELKEKVLNQTWARGFRRRKNNKIREKGICLKSPKDKKAQRMALTALEKDYKIETKFVTLNDEKDIAEKEYAVKFAKQALTKIKESLVAKNTQEKETAKYAFHYKDLVANLTRNNCFEPYFNGVKKKPRTLQERKQVKNKRTSKYRKAFNLKERLKRAAERAKAAKLIKPIKLVSLIFANKLKYNVAQVRHFYTAVGSRTKTEGTYPDMLSGRSLEQLYSRRKSVEQIKDST